MSDVLISCSRKDKDFVRQLHDPFVKLQREAWVDWQDIPLTAEWQQEIYGRHRERRQFFLPHHPRLGRVRARQNEVAHAAKDDKRLIRVLRRSVPDAEIPKELAKINFVYFRESDPFDTTFKSLVDTLDADLDWISFPVTGEDLLEPKNGRRKRDRRSRERLHCRRNTFWQAHKRKRVARGSRWELSWAPARP